jgi:3-hydroxyacyl-CoA dehydrogenase/enoyl-CoA hydratase/3-hydroxybutyryl-CoA epimerase
MGSGIAALTVDRAGLPICLADLTDDTVRRGLRSIRRILDRRVARGQLTPLERDRRMHRVGGTIGYRGFHACDLTIEAVIEDLETKRAVLRVVQACNERAIFASNTSALPIARLAEASDYPEQVIGMHYFFPVAKMPLLEIAVTDQTSPEVIATCVELGRRQGKQVIVVRDGVGFFTTRVLGAYLHEALTLLRGGAPIDAIDDALMDFGFPIGPLALIDEVGIDIAQEIAATLEGAFGERMRSSDVAAELVAFDRRGRKSARGFYRYADGQRGAADEEIYQLLELDPNPRAFDAKTIAWRCVLRLIDEAVRCFADGVIRSARDGDAGAVFGLGFPPFRGGPFRMVATLGAVDIVERMQRYGLEVGILLREMARTGTSFSEARSAADSAPHAEL